jgi:hypothetical protein
MSKPLRVSWSGLRSHEECHQRSFLIRDGKKAKVSNIRNFFHGTVVDSIMRRWLDDPEHTPGGMVEMVDQLMIDTETEEKEHGNIVRWRNAADRDDVRQFCTELVTRLEPILVEHVLPYTYEHGKWFKVPMTLTDDTGHARDILLTGEMDLIVDNQGPVIWDLKGTADDQYWRKVAAQLVFYDIAVWASSGQKTRGVGLIQPMCSERIKAWQVTDDFRRQLLSRIERYARDVWAGEKTCTDNTAACHWCTVKHACPKYAQPSLDAFGELAVGLREAPGDAA